MLAFKDCLHFLGAFVEQIGKNLRASGRDKFKLLRAEFPHATTDQLDLLLRKQVYPYEYMNSRDPFNETSLTPKDAFFEKHCGQDRSDEEYAHAQKLWSTIGCKTILDYHYLFLKCMSTLLSSFITLLPSSSTILYELPISTLSTNL